jgi:hypothetical protein
MKHIEYILFGLVFWYSAIAMQPGLFAVAPVLLMLMRFDVKDFHAARYLLRNLSTI